MHSRRSFHLCILLFPSWLPVHPYYLTAVPAFQLYHDHPETGFPNVADPLPALAVRASHFLDTYHLLSPLKSAEASIGISQ